MSSLDTADVAGPDAPAGMPARRYEDAVAEVVRGRLVTPHFQPIVDMHHGTVLAWEVLSRGPEAFPSPAELFAAAEKLG